MHGIYVYVFVRSPKCIRTRVNVCMCVHTYTSARVCTYLSIDTYKHACMHIHALILYSIHAYIPYIEHPHYNTIKSIFCILCVYVCMYICTYICRQTPELVPQNDNVLHMNLVLSRQILAPACRVITCLCKCMHVYIYIHIYIYEV